MTSSSANSWHGPAVWLTERTDARDAWHRLAARAGADVLVLEPEGSHPFSPWINAFERRADGEVIVRRFERGHADPVGEDDPLLPDPDGACRLVAEALLDILERRPLLLHVLAPELWSADSVGVLPYVVRCIDAGMFAVLIDASVSLASLPHWRVACAAFDRSVGITVVGAPARCERTANDQAPDRGEAVRLAECGALLASHAALGEEIGDDNFEQARLRARLALLHGRHDIVDIATGGMRRQAKSDRERALAVRIDLLVRRAQLDTPTPERPATTSTRALLLERPIDGVPLGWVVLDDALRASLGSQAVAMTERIALMPAREASSRCLATSHIWSGVAAYLNDRPDVAILCFEAALPLLDALGEERRALHVRLRLGALLGALDSAGEACLVLRRAADSAFALGQADAASQAVGEAASAAAIIGDRAAMRKIGAFCGWKGRTLALYLRRSGQRHRALACLALSDGDTAQAKECAQAVLEAPEATPLTRFEATWLLLRAWAPGSDQAARQLEQCWRLVDRLDPQEQPLARLRMAAGQQ